MFTTIVEIKGKQYPTKAGDTILVDKINEENDKEFNDIKVLLHKSNDDVLIGTPFLENVKVKAKVQETIRGKKVKVVHYKPKSGIRKTQGHKQSYTSLHIENIEVN